MPQAILARDKEGVMSVWELQGCPMWSLWETKAAPAFSCSDDRPEIRRTELLYYLDIIKNSGTVCDYTVKFHEDVPAGKKINSNTPVYGSLTFKLNDQGVMAPAASAAATNNAGVTMMNELFAAKLENLEAKWERKMEDMEREHEEELRELEEENEKRSGTEINGIIGQIGQATQKYPVFAEIVKDWSTVLKHMVTKTFAPASSRPASNIAGVGEPPQKIVSSAIQTLAGYYVGKHGYFAEGISDEKKDEISLIGWKEFAGDMTLLAGLTADPDTFELALKKLRQLA